MKKKYIVPKTEVIMLVEYANILGTSGGLSSREDNYDEEDYY